MINLNGLPDRQGTHTHTHKFAYKYEHGKNRSKSINQSNGLYFRTTGNKKLPSEHLISILFSTNKIRKTK